MDEEQPEQAEIQTGDLPKDFQDELQRFFNDYSVFIARARNNDARTFTPLGSGVFVVRDDRFGILTAHHCVHGENPKAQLYDPSSDTLLLILRGGRQLAVNPGEIAEIPLASPKGTQYGEYGPDLTFLQILHPERLNSLKAISSFWNLNQEPRPIEDKFAKPKTPIVSIGYPGLEYKTEILANDIHHKVTHIAYLNAIADGEITFKDSWDYIDLTFVHDGQPDLPEDLNLSGVSGGPVWAYEILISRKTRKFSVGKFALVAIQFWATPLIDRRRSIRAHFIRSIYDLGWTHGG